jgi:hypothetical protein
MAAGCLLSAASYLLVDGGTPFRALSRKYESRGRRAGSREQLARIFHEFRLRRTATTGMAVLPGVLGCRPLRRTVQVRLGANTLRLPGGTPILVVSRQLFMKYPG